MGQLPSHEPYDVAARLVQKLGYRVVVIPFETCILAQDRKDVTLDSHFVVATYTASARQDLETYLARHVKPSMIQFLTSLVNLRTRIIITFQHSDWHNGEVFTEAHTHAQKSGYLYEGLVMVKNVMQHCFQHLHFMELHEGEFTERSSDILFIDTDPKVVYGARKKHMGGILFES